jgi:transcriptional regulator with XRE-family HTH domain
MTAPHPQSPIVKRRRLGSELRRLREEARLTGDQVVELAGWASASKLSRLENGKSRPDTRDIQRLLDIYGVHGPRRDELLEITGHAEIAMRGWMKSYQVMTESQREYAELEAGCAEIREYSSVIVPGLLQTVDYARVRIASAQRLASESRPPAGEPFDLEKEVGARLERQSVFTDPHPPRYTALLDEAALDGHTAPPEVIRGQLQHLCELARMDNVTIQVIRRGATLGDWYLPHTAFSLYRFPDLLDGETAAIEGIATHLTIHDLDELNSYKVLFEWLQAAALPAEESIEWLTDAAGRHPDATRTQSSTALPATPPTQRRGPHPGRLTKK